jgi:gas vesicle protein
MNRNLSWIAALAAAFAGGLLTGILFAPRTGRDLRQSIASRALEPAHWAEERLQEIERQLVALERDLRASSTEFGEKLRETTHRTVSHYVPEVPDDTKAWNVDSPEVTRDLPRMPH